MDDELKALLLEIDGDVATVSLNRPEVHNAFNEVMIAELTRVFRGITGGEDRFESIRAVVLTGEGKSFCAGADLNWMGKMRDFTYEENIADSLALSDCLYSIYECPLPVVARVNGAAIGGGCGMFSACDIAVAGTGAKFSLSEVRLGLVPACISPYVIKRIGESKTRELFLTGRRFMGPEAERIGLVNSAVSPERLDESIKEITDHIVAAGPEALHTCKHLIKNVVNMDLDDARHFTAEIIAKLRISDEGQEGMAAFFEKRKPSWIKE